MKYLSVIDLNRNELQNAVIQNLAADPSTPAPGQFWYRTNISNGTANGVLRFADQSGNVFTVATGSSGLSNAYSTVTDGSTPQAASGADTLTVSAVGTGLTVDTSTAKTVKYTLNSGLTGANKVLLLTAGGKVTASVMQEVLALADLTDVTATTGTGSTAVFNDTPTILTPTIASLVNSNHSHLNAAGGGTITAAAVSDFDTQVRTSTLNQMTAPTADLSINSHKLTNITDPTSAQDGATKAYVDLLVQGLSGKTSVRAATAVAGTLVSSFENGDAIDGVTLATGDRILLKDQAAPAENGIYIVAASGAPTRATDADIAAEFAAGIHVFVEEGTANADSGWVLTTDGAITLNTTPLAFVQFSGAGQITAGAGLTKNANTIDVGTASSGRIVVNADNIDLASGIVAAGTYTKITVDTYGRATTGADIIASNGLVGRTAAATFTNITITGTVGTITVTNGDGVAGNPTITISGTYVGQASITTLGTITTGIWNGTTIAVANGGTGQTTAALARGTAGLGAQTAPANATNVVATARGIPTKCSFVITHTGAATDFVCTHNLGTVLVSVEVWDASTPPKKVMVDADATDANTVTIKFAVAQANTTVFTAVIIG